MHCNIYHVQLPVTSCKIAVLSSTSQHSACSEGRNKHTLAPMIDDRANLFQLVGFESVILCICLTTVSNGHPPDRDHTVHIVSYPCIILGPPRSTILIKKGWEEASNRMLGGKKTRSWNTWLTGSY